jgi:hypothetical protein
LRAALDALVAAGALTGFAPWSASHRRKERGLALYGAKGLRLQTMLVRK